MALIPLKDKVTITPPSNTDVWGNPINGVPKTYPCRIDEGTKLVRDQQGNEIVSNTKILIEKTVAVDYDYDISFSDVTGKTVTRRPLFIGRIKDISSNVLFTEVNL